MTTGVGFTADYLTYHASVRPDHPAMIDRGREIGYRQFHEDLRRVVAALAALEIPPGGFVAVEGEDLYRHWLLLQGFECLGIATFSYAGGSAMTLYGPLITAAALVVWHAVEIETAGRQLHTDDVWWQAVLARLPLPDLPPNPPPDRVLRITCSSGTTAKAKAMPITAAQSDFRLGGYHWSFDLSPQTRHLVEAGFARQGEYVRSVATLRAGGTVIYAGGPYSWSSLTAAHPTHMNCLPSSLTALLAQGDPEIWPDKICISTYGGSVSDGFRHRLLSGIASAVTELYGTNETGALAIARDDGALVVLPGVTLQIVDDQDKVLPIGVSGRVRIRSPGCVRGYLAAPDTEKISFRHGWFYPGDVGVLERSTLLRLQGRRDDILNICGIKLFAPEYEARFQQITGLADVAVTEILESQGMSMLCVVMVPLVGADMAIIRRQINPHLTANFAKFYLIAADAIPRTQTGKIRRRALRELAQKAVSVDG